MIFIVLRAASSRPCTPRTTFSHRRTSAIESKCMWHWSRQQKPEKIEEKHLVLNVGWKDAVIRKDFKMSSSRFILCVIYPAGKFGLYIVVVTLLKAIKPTTFD